MVAAYNVQERVLEAWRLRVVDLFNRVYKERFGPSLFNPMGTKSIVCFRG
jgi:hypothetical protein